MYECILEIFIKDVFLKYTNLIYQMDFFPPVL